MVAIRCWHPVTARLATTQARLLHEASDPIASMAVASFAQLFQYAWAAVGLPALVMNRFDRIGQGLVGRRAWTGRSAPPLSVVVAAGRNVQVQAERQNRVLVFHRIDPFIPLADGSERMPNVFLNGALLSQVTNLALRSIQLALLQIAHRALLGRRRPPPATAGTSFLQA